MLRGNIKIGNITRYSRYLSTNTPSSSSSSSPSSSSLPNLNLLYEIKSARDIIFMGLATGINFTYWGLNTSFTLVDNVVNNPGKFLLQGAEIDAGLLCLSAGFIYFASVYSEHCIYRCYENTANKTLRFQVHTLLGRPGKLLEIPIGNASIIETKSNAIGVRVEGLGKNLVFGDADLFNTNERLKYLLSVSREEFAKLEKQERQTSRKNYSKSK